MTAQPVTTPQPDIVCSGYGESIILITPQNDKARAWLEENTEGMWYAGALAVEPRYATPIVEALMDDGFFVQ